MTHFTCRLTAKNRDQLRDPTLSNRVRATFTFNNGLLLEQATVINRKLQRRVIGTPCTIAHCRLIAYHTVFVLFLLTFLHFTEAL